MTQFLPLFPETVTKEQPDFSVASSQASFHAMQQRLPKYHRTVLSAAAVQNRQITDRSLDLISYIEHYKILPTSLLLKLVNGNEDITYRHLQTLYHKKLVNRFAFPSSLNPGEFNYYLDNSQALDLLVEAGWSSPQDLDYDRIRYNRDKQYSTIHFEPKRQGSLLYLNHEVDISRFHAMLELGCRASQGKAELIDWRQGPELWRKVQAPKLSYDGQRNLWGEEDRTEQLPHRPDAFFTLRHNTKPQGQQDTHFFYERERKTTTDRKRIIRKLRAHFHYIVKKQQHKIDYGVSSIRAVLVETTDDHWALRLRESAAHPIVCGPKPSPLFWFTTSRLFELGPNKDESGQYEKRKDFFLSTPEIIFHGVWATPAGETLHSLFD